MYDTQDMARRIKDRVKFCGFNMKTMLFELGLGINIISHLAKGQVISSINLAKIADYLDCSVDYLLGRTDNPAFVPKSASKLRTLPTPGGRVAAMDGLYTPPAEELSPEARAAIDKAARAEREKYKNNGGHPSK